MQPEAIYASQIFKLEDYVEKILLSLSINSKLDYSDHNSIIFLNSLETQNKFLCLDFDGLTI